MALDPSTEAAFVGRFTAADASYPYGSTKEETSAGANDGTPFTKRRDDDVWGFHQALLVAGSVTPSGNPDTVLASDYLTAINNLIGGAVVTDHGGLTGLGDDDHTQYILASGSRAFSGVVSGVTPTIAAHLATKGYVDTTVVTDHGGLTGLGDDDHTQYTKADGTRAFTGTVSGVTPTANAHLATKQYVDDNAGVSVSVLSNDDTDSGSSTAPVLSVSTGIATANWDASSFNLGINLYAVSNTANNELFIGSGTWSKEAGTDDSEFAFTGMYPDSGDTGNGTGATTRYTFTSEEDNTGNIVESNGATHYTALTCYVTVNLGFIDFRTVLTSVFGQDFTRLSISGIQFS